MSTEVILAQEDQTESVNLSCSWYDTGLRLCLNLRQAKPCRIQLRTAKSPTAHDMFQSIPGLIRIYDAIEMKIDWCCKSRTAEVHNLNPGKLPMPFFNERPRYEAKLICISWLKFQRIRCFVWYL